MIDRRNASKQSKSRYTAGKKEYINIYFDEPGIDVMNVRVTVISNERREDPGKKQMSVTMNKEQSR